jgi:flagellar hook-associated protein 1 FlgK
MASSFGGINTALTSLYAQRRGLDVTGENIANVNTEGYTRQRVDMQSQTGSISPAMWAKTDGVGTGVAVTDVQRLRDDYLEGRGRTEHGNSAYLTQQAATYSSIEDTFGEPADTALQASLGDMWNSWNDVANNPKDKAARSALIEQSSTVADALNSAHDSLAGQWSQSGIQLKAYVDDVNNTAKAVAELNDTIVNATASGLGVNELQDRRDTAVMHLSELTGATASKRANGAVDVFVGNSTLVSEFTTRNLEVAGAVRLDDQATQPMTLQWEDTKTPSGAGGTMGSMVDSMTTIIPQISDALDKVAAKLAATVNTAHAAGYSADGSTGLDFFSGTTAGTIKVALTDPDQVATSSAPGSVDNSVADTMADIGTTTNGPDADYQSMIGQLGVSAEASNRRTDIQANVTEQVDASRESMSGVNLDEEMTNLLKYQRGYEAASRVLTTIDSMLDQLINRTGLVGR